MPTAVVLHNSRQADHPGCELNVNVGHVRAQEEWSLRVADFDDLGDLVLQLLRGLSLLVEILGLKQLVE